MKTSDQPLIIERRIGSQTVRANCSEAYARAAENVLNEFEKLAHSGMSLRVGTEIRFGWTLLHLSDDNNSLLVTEPDFAHWPDQHWSRTIDTSLEVLTAQVRLLHRLNVNGVDAFFDQFVISAPDALSQRRIFLRRENSISAENSGWLLGSVEYPEALIGDVKLERIPIASLVRLRPIILQALILPKEFIVMFSGDFIKQIFDSEGRCFSCDLYLGFA